MPHSHAPVCSGTLNLWPQPSHNPPRRTGRSLPLQGTFASASYQLPWWCSNSGLPHKTWQFPKRRIWRPWLRAPIRTSLPTPVTPKDREGLRSPGVPVLPLPGSPADGIHIPSAGDPMAYDAQKADDVGMTQRVALFLDWLRLAMIEPQQGISALSSMDLVDATLKQRQGIRTSLVPPPPPPLRIPRSITSRCSSPSRCKSRPHRQPLRGRWWIQQSGGEQIYAASSGSTTPA